MTISGFSEVKKNELLYYTCDAFGSTGLVSHAFTTRCGGVSSGCLESLNLGVNRGDALSNVMENYDIICEAIGIKKENTVFSRQTHSDVVQCVDASFCGNGLFRENVFDDADALVTNERGVALTIFMADCVPLLFLDPVRRVIAACHSGWRGTVQRIAEKTVETMRDRYGSDPRDILCAIGPSIGPCCFEVDAPVANEFKEKFGSSFVRNREEGKFDVDLWSVNAQILKEVGLSDKNVSIIKKCTFCSPDDFFSHRRMGTKRGSQVAIIQLL